MDPTLCESHRQKARKVLTHVWFSIFIVLWISPSLPFWSGWLLPPSLPSPLHAFWPAVTGHTALPSTAPTGMASAGPVLSHAFLYCFPALLPLHYLGNYPSSFSLFVLHCYWEHMYCVCVYSWDKGCLQGESDGFCCIFFGDDTVNVEEFYSFSNFCQMGWNMCMTKEVTAVHSSDNRELICDICLISVFCPNIFVKL